MKIITSFLIVILFAACADGQKVKEDAVPPSVVSAFHKMYPEVKQHTWYHEDANYEAEYNEAKMEMAVTFDKEGNLMETENEIPVNNLPKGIADYVSKNYSGAAIREASIVTDAKGVKTYEAEIKGTDLIFDEQGKFLKKEKD